MTTRTLKTTHTKTSTNGLTLPRILRRISRGLLTLLTILVALLSAIPVILLFFVTSVPAFIAAGLVLIDLGMIAALFWLDRTLPTMVGAIVGWVAVAGLAVVLSQAFATDRKSVV